MAFCLSAFNVGMVFGPAVGGEKLIYIYRALTTF